MAKRDSRRERERIEWPFKVLFSKWNKTFFFSFKRWRMKKWVWGRMIASSLNWTITHYLGIRRGGGGAHWTEKNKKWLKINRVPQSSCAIQWFLENCSEEYDWSILLLMWDDRGTNVCRCHHHHRHDHHPCRHHHSYSCSVSIFYYYIHGKFILMIFLFDSRNVNDLLKF